ncbi:Threonine synthase [archaeon HR01]|nr:Threonine synthase [archaeon HR01]
MSDVRSEILLRCISCGREFPADSIIYFCGDCGNLLDVVGDIGRLNPIELKNLWASRKFTMWRYRELIPVEREPITLHEGGTPLYRAEKAARWADVKNLYVKFEGGNPTGSFKDRGMSVAITKSLELGRETVICASTGNTSSSMAAYAAAAGVKAIVLVPRGRVAAGKLFQTMLHGAETYTVDEGFDTALQTVLSSSRESGIYILNSVNPWRIEGQKTLAYEVWEVLGDGEYVVSVPVGNCGNISAIWKGFKELEMVGLARTHPRLVGVQAEGASPFVDMVRRGDERLIPVESPRTIASAIRIGKPVNWLKALRAIRESEGLVEKVSDEMILEAQRLLASGEGIGVEPASAASLAGVKKLREQGLLDRSETVVCVATGHALKDPNPDLVPNKPRESSYLARR